MDPETQQRLDLTGAIPTPSEKKREKMERHLRPNYDLLR